MSFYRISNPVASDFDISDLGITIAASATNVVLSDDFAINDLYLSADLEDAIINGDLTVEIDYGTGFSSVAAGDYTNRDALAAFLNVFEITNENDNEDLVDGSDASTLHNHDSIYFTETELGSTTGPSGASLIGLDGSSFVDLSTSIDDLQEFADAVDAALDAVSGTVDLDTAYDNDSDGILLVDGTTKPLNFRSNNANDIVISRIDGADIQEALEFDVSADELLLGHAVEGALAAINVRVRTNLTIDGDLTVTGTTTDTTVNELNVTNANILLRSGADAIAAADAALQVERGTSGADAELLWDESAGRWVAGLVGSTQTIALLEEDEVVTGIWEFQGGGASDPSVYFTDKASAPSTNLGSSSQIPMAMINNQLAVYDKTRAKWLSMNRKYVVFTGRNNRNNRNEYARHGDFTSNQGGVRLIQNATIVGISAQTNGAETWNAQIRSNGSTTNIATLSLSAVAGAQDDTVDVDLSAGDQLQAYIDGTGVDRPTIVVELAYRF